jgi:hypothetical protein
VNVFDEPTQIVASEGCVIMAGRLFTVNVATLEVAFPQLLFNKHRYLYPFMVVVTDDWV